MIELLQLLAAEQTAKYLYTFVYADGKKRWRTALRPPVRTGWGSGSWRVLKSRAGEKMLANDADRKL